MSVLVKGIKMPRDCYECKVWSQCFDEKPPFNMIKSVCPLVEVKEPHGKLGDLDALQEQIKRTMQDAHMSVLWKQGMAYAHGLVETSKTVIEAEGSEET